MARLLLIEDNVEFAKMLQTSLKSVGHRVRTVVSLAEGLEIARDRHIDLVITDLFLGSSGRRAGATGFDTIWQLQKLGQELGRAIPVIVISGAFPTSGRINLLTFAERLGAVAALEKPFHPDELLTAITIGLMPAGKVASA